MDTTTGLQGKFKLGRSLMKELPSLTQRVGGNRERSKENLEEIHHETNFTNHYLNRGTRPQSRERYGQSQI